MIAIIQAGGAGTRLKSIAGDLPKPMVRICDKPILQWQIENLKSFGIKEIYIAVSDKSTAVQDYFSDGRDFGVKIRYIIENEPLGSGGVLYSANKLFDEDFILLFGDLMIDVDWEKFVSAHKETGALITAFSHPNSHPFDSDLIVANPDGLVLGLDSKSNSRNYAYENLTNAGLYIIGKNLLGKYSAVPRKIDFEKNVLAPEIKQGNVYAYRSSEYVKDCGTPDRYYSVEKDCKSGIVSLRNLAKVQQCIFLDRDGTINVFGDFVTKASMLKLMPDAAESIAKINASSYLAICITNQPVVARGETTFAELRNIHNQMEDLLGEKGAYLNDLFFCPHHPDKGYPGEVPELKIVCDCRKPKIGMLLRAQKRYNIDFKKSWFVGDTLQDVQTGINAGCRTILLTCGDPHPAKRWPNAKPDFVCKSLHDAVQTILDSK